MADVETHQFKTCFKINNQKWSMDELNISVIMIIYIHILGRLIDR